MATCIYTWSDIRTDWLLKGKLTQKWKYCHQLYILVSFQTHMSYFLCGAQIEMIRRMWMLHIHWKCIKSNHSIPQNISFSIYTVLIKSYGFGPTWWLNDERNAFFDGCTTPLTLIGLRWNKKKTDSDDGTLTCKISENYRSERSLVSLLSICQMKIWMYVKCDLRYVSLSFLSSPADCSLQLQYSLKHQCCFEA